MEESHILDLFNTIIKLNNIEDCKILFEDLCTKQEIDKMAQRITAAKLLKEGKTYEEIIKITEISSATLSRVSTCVKYGKGYNKFIESNEKN